MAQTATASAHKTSSSIKQPIKTLELGGIAILKNSAVLGKYLGSTKYLLHF